MREEKPIAQNKLFKELFSFTQATIFLPCPSHDPYSNFVFLKTILINNKAETA